MPDLPIVRLHDELRKAARGQWAVFLGAGSSYDFGIPTMLEMAERLKTILTDAERAPALSATSVEVLRAVIPDAAGTARRWDVEQLLTRLYQVYEALHGGDMPFASVSAYIGERLLSPQQLQQTEQELLSLMAGMCELDSYASSGHGGGSVEYLANFITSFSAFGDCLNVFTTNIDQCFEAATVRLSQRPRRERRAEFRLVDGFDTGLVPTFDLGNYRTSAERHGVRPVFYWKLHGSIDWTFSSSVAASGNSRTDTAPDPVFDDSSIIMRRNDQLWSKLHSCGAVNTPPDANRRRIAIFPTPAKYSQTYTFPYMDLFEAFRRTLEQTQILVVVGTSFPDQHIRSAVRSFCERDNTLLFVIDPCVTEGALTSVLGQSKSIQPIISKGFADFIEEFQELEQAGESVSYQAGVGGKE
jgi:NAD-dependent SIR2 family protein deacetylase